MPGLEDYYLIIGGFVVVIVFLLGLLIGRMLDQYYRIRQMRRFLHKDYLILKKVNKDAKTILARIINADTTAFLHRGSVWVAEQGRIYRDLGFEKGGKVRIKEGGFDYRPGQSEVPIRYEEGIPVIYVDDEHLKPLNFNNEEAKATPSGVGGTLVAWVTNQIAKGNNDKKTYMIFFILLGLLATASLYFAWQANQQLNDIKATCTAPPAIPAANQTGTVIITASGVSTSGGGAL